MNRSAPAQTLSYLLRTAVTGMLIIWLAMSWKVASAQSTEVDPLIGTKGMFTYGRTTPFVTPPFGMTHWTPMTHYPDIAWCQYHYGRRRIIGFRGSHKPAMWMGDYGYVTLAPGSGRHRVSARARGFRFRRTDEKSHPFRYENAAKNGRQFIQMAATEHCAIFEMEMDAHKPWIYIEASKKKNQLGTIRIDPDSLFISGYNSDRAPIKIQPEKPEVRGYFWIEISEPLRGFRYAVGKSHASDSNAVTGERVGLFLDFVRGQKIRIKVGTSFISSEMARRNLDAEIPGWEVESIAKQTQATWDSLFSRIQVVGGDSTDRRIFHTALYHSLLFPRSFSEQGQYYSPFDGKVHEGKSYSDFSLWDTFRAEHPLLLLIAPERAQEMVQVLVQMYEEGGWMPKWPNPVYTNIMIGTHADAVVADAATKGYTGFNLETAWEAVYKNAMTPPDGDSLKRWEDRADWSGYEARGGLSWYKKLGFVPADKTAESVSRTIEFSYDDYCVAQFARVLGKKQEAAFFLERSHNYRNLYNPETGFFAPKNADGSWYKKSKEGFTEGSPWTYLFGAMHDPEGMIDLMGRDHFTEMLNRNFEEGHYVHENEPGHHYCYLFNYLGQPWRTQELVAKYRREKYRDAPDGLDGDDDCGQMSAWYIFSALGFYPVCPGSGEYAIGTPLFPEVVLRPHPGDPEKTFRIIAPEVSPENIYVQEVLLNGVRLKRPFLKHADILRGGTLEFRMGAEPRGRD